MGQTLSLAGGCLGVCVQCLVVFGFRVEYFGFGCRVSGVKVL